MINNNRGMLKGINECNIKEYERITGLEFNQKVLRFIPYVLNRAVNNSFLDYNKVTPEEREIAKQWTELDVCLCYPLNRKIVFPNLNFYITLCYILYDGYIPEEEDD